MIRLHTFTYYVFLVCTTHENDTYLPITRGGFPILLHWIVYFPTNIHKNRGFSKQGTAILAQLYVMARRQKALYVNVQDIAGVSALHGIRVSVHLYINGWKVLCTKLQKNE